ncbi:MAG: homocysteine S-methyltransferase family protein [Acidobacteria bacterium]|nr:homocysteine S-methyltransferase family protein [Acidobacteriota bacterium]
MNDILQRLRAGEVLVADGAMGTLLMARGLPAGHCPEWFNLEHPEVLEEIARRYTEAGADLVQANTFGGSPLKLAPFGLADRAAVINRAAVEAARRGAVGRAHVAASVGPTGKLLKPLGDADPAEVLDGYRLQMRALFEAGADLVCVETMTDLDEAVMAVRAAKEAAPGVPVSASMTFDRARRGWFTMMGVGTEKAVRGLEAAGADLVGANCGNGIDAMVELCRELRALTTLPLVIRPNAGIPAGVGTDLAWPEDPDYFAERAPALLAAGANVLGGCCGTGPDHVRALRAAVDARGHG